MIKLFGSLSLLWFTTSVSAANVAAERSFPAFDGRTYFAVAPNGRVNALPVIQPQPLAAALSQIRLDGRRTLVAYGDEASTERFRTLLRYGYPFAEPSVANAEGHLVPLMELVVRTFDVGLIREVVAAQGTSAFCSVHLRRLLQDELKMHDYLVGTIGAAAVRRLGKEARLGERHSETLSTFRSELNVNLYPTLRVVKNFAYATKNEPLAKWLESPACYPLLSSEMWDI